MDGEAPVLIPPRGGTGIGDYTLRDFAAKWLVQQEDLAEVARYRTENRVLATVGDDRKRVVLFGDSITEFWPEVAFPPADAFQLINRGIAGQNTSQMLLRFEDDVVALAPHSVVVLGGTNDMRSYAGSPAAVAAGAMERIARNITAMADIAAARGIRFVIATLPPVGDQPDVWREPSAIVKMNHWLKFFAAQRSLPLVDYAEALADVAGMLPHGLSEDGVHPNPAGYARMAYVLARTLDVLASHCALRPVVPVTPDLVSMERQA